MGDKLTTPFEFFQKLGGNEKVETVYNYTTGPLWNFVLTTMWILGVIALLAGIYFTVKIIDINKRIHEKEHEEIAHRKQTEAKPYTHLAWENIINNLHGSSEAYWRLAIMDSDSLLDAMLIDLGLQGPSVGDKLKQISSDRMRSLNEAWEAHKIRNRIAHDGVNFQISQREAQRVVYMYEQAFREFGYI